MSDTPLTENLVYSVGRYGVQASETKELAPPQRLAQCFKDIEYLERRFADLERENAELRRQLEAANIELQRYHANAPAGEGWAQVLERTTAQNHELRRQLIEVLDKALEDAALVCDEFARGSDRHYESYKECADAIRQLKGKQS